MIRLLHVFYGRSLREALSSKHIVCTGEFPKIYSLLYKYVKKLCLTV
jgi:hypothetical protein